MNLADGFERENRGYREVPATIPCGLLAKLQRKGHGRNQPCRDRFFTELGRELHHAEEHFVGLALVEAPSSPVGQQRCSGEEDGTTAGDGRHAPNRSLRPGGLPGAVHESPVASTLVEDRCSATPLSRLQNRPNPLTLRASPKSMEASPCPE